ncbi:MAG: universal stress protein [Cyclobacteriaceae bacterium]
MKQINNIVVPIDFSQESNAGITASCSFARKFNGKIHFINTISDELVESDDEHALKQLQFQKKVVRKKRLTKLMSTSVPQSLQGKSFASFGTMTNVINQFSIQVDIDLIITATSGSRNFIEFFGGNDTEDLIRENDIPVIAVPEDEDLTFKNLLIATDLGREVPNTIFKVCKFLQSEGAGLHFVNIITTELIEKDEVKKKIESMTQRSDIEKCEVHVESNSDEVQGILEVARKIDADIILMKTYQKSRFWTLVKGSLSEQLVRKSEIPVMVENIDKVRK